MANNSIQKWDPANIVEVLVCWLTVTQRLPASINFGLQQKLVLHPIYIWPVVDKVFSMTVCFKE